MLSHCHGLLLSPLSCHSSSFVISPSRWVETVWINSSDEPYLNNILLITITFKIKYIEIPPREHNYDASHFSLSVLKTAGIYSTIPVVIFTT